MNKIYSKKQLEVLRACKASDWFMLTNHGAKRSGKTQVDNDLFLQELIRVRGIANNLGIDIPQYILARYSLGNIQDNILTELSNKYGFEFKFDKYNNVRLFGVSRCNAERLMRTELARVQTEAQMQSFERNGYEGYEFIALGISACEICKGLDGKHFKVKDMMPGENAPSIHPNCRCSTVAWMDEKEYEEWLNENEDIENYDKDDTIKKTEDKAIIDVHTIGKLDRNIYKCIAEDIVTDEVVITDNQIQHIKDRHPNDYERFSSYFGEIVKNPDYIIEANKPDAAVILKEIIDNGEKFQMVLRMCTSKEPRGYKNSRRKDRRYYELYS